MAYSTCCNAHTNYPEINLCPECLEYCDWEEEDDDDDDDDDEAEKLANQIDKEK